MAYTLEEIKELVETLTPIVKNAIEAGSLSVEDLRVAESMDFVNSLPALEEKGLNVSYVKVRLKDLLGKLDGDYAKGAIKDDPMMISLTDSAIGLGTSIASLL